MAIVYHLSNAKEIKSIIEESANVHLDLLETEEVIVCLFGMIAVEVKSLTHKLDSVIVHHLLSEVVLIACQLVVHLDFNLLMVDVSVREELQK